MTAAVHVRIAVPCYGGVITAACHRSITLLTHALNAAAVNWTLDHELHESLVQRARNGLVHRFLCSDATHLLFVDADIEFRPADVLGMLAADKPLVCGAYPRKTLDRNAVVAAAQRYERDPFRFAAQHNVNVLPGAPGETEATLTAVDGCVPILEAATGFLLLQRDVLLQMAAALPETLYYSDSAQNRGEAMHALFDCAIVGGRYLSEDWLFSRRWRDLGGTVWLYLAAQLGHVGSYTYRGDLFTKFVPVDAGPSGWHPEEAVESDLPEESASPDSMVERYEWAAAHVKGPNVADACCGPGYGMPILARGGARVTGFDRSAANMHTATARGFGAMVLGDVTGQSFAGYDAVVSLETLEHLPDPVGWLAGFDASVKELAISVPSVPTKHRNKWHLHDFTHEGVLMLLQALGWDVKGHHSQRGDVVLAYAVRE